VEINPIQKARGPQDQGLELSEGNLNPAGSENKRRKSLKRKVPRDKVSSRKLGEARGGNLSARTSQISKYYHY